MRDVKIGDRDKTIPKFSGYKVVRAGRIVKAITQKYPSIVADMAKFERDFETQNTVRITRAMSKLPKFQALGLTNRDFEKVDFVEYPQSPSQWQIVASVFPAIMDIAESEIAVLLALVLAPNSELAEKDDDGAIDEYLHAEGRKLLFEADADQVWDVAVAVGEILNEQFAQKLGDSGNLIALFSGNVTPGGANQESKKTSPESSTDSPEPTGGPEDKSSTIQVGAS